MGRDIQYCCVCSVLSTVDLSSVVYTYAYNRSFYNVQKPDFRFGVFKLGDPRLMVLSVAVPVHRVAIVYFVLEVSICTLMLIPIVSMLMSTSMSKTALLNMKLVFGFGNLVLSTWLDYRYYTYNM
ncbi:hypothetical protein F4810DRAFT_432892 [Camillea tinctor]|nr:hypothetical protein F4810DRAFT_432892 [Camillea tinctor]